MPSDLIVDGELMLYGPVGGSWWDDGGFTATEVLQALAEMEGDITVRLNSGGGIAWDGIAIYNALHARASKVTVVIDGVAASAASVIAMGGDDIVMRTGALMMIHDASTITWGTAEDHEKSAALLGKLDGQLAAVYAARTGLDLSEISGLMDAETWMDGAEAVEKGFATAAGAEKAAKASAFDYRLYAHAPKPLVASARKLKAPRPVGEWGVPLNAAMARRKTPAQPAATSEPPMPNETQTGTAPAVPANDNTPAKTERERISAILDHPEAVGREGLARHLALAHDMSAEEAVKILAKAEKSAPAADGLGALRESAPKVVIGGDAKPENRSEDGTPRSLDSAVDRFNAAFKRR